MIEYCICGHLKTVHELTDSPKNPPGSHFCRGCCGMHPRPDIYGFSWHNFKLDNLKFIEDLAKQKNLI